MLRISEQIYTMRTSFASLTTQNRPQKAFFLPVLSEVERLSSIVEQI